MMSEQNSEGFTLLEMVISMTILSMVVLMIYFSFSVGVDLWRKKQESDNPLQRLELALRLLSKDLESVVDYTCQWEKGTTYFFAGSQSCLFYVTRNGLGAVAREDKALFFTCLYLKSGPDGDMELFVSKTPDRKSVV